MQLLKETSRWAVAWALTSVVTVDLVLGASARLMVPANFPASGVRVTHSV